jgi:hypothetical protein
LPHREVRRQVEYHLCIHGCVGGQTYCSEKCDPVKGLLVTVDLTPVICDDVRAGSQSLVPTSSCPGSHLSVQVREHCPDTLPV